MISLESSASRASNWPVPARGTEVSGSGVFNLLSAFVTAAVSSGPIDATTSRASPLCAFPNDAGNAPCQGAYGLATGSGSEPMEVAK